MDYNFIEIKNILNMGGIIKINVFELSGDNWFIFYKCTNKMFYWYLPKRNMCFWNELGTNYTVKDMFEWCYEKITYEVIIPKEVK